jgi:hypothetical protein
MLQCAVVVSQSQTYPVTYLRMSLAPPVEVIRENVARKDIKHALPAYADDGTSEKTSWKHYVWDSWDKSPEERRLIFKVFSSRSICSYPGD